MKQLLLLAALIFSFNMSFAQTTWTGGGANDNWNNVDNWDTAMIPTAADDVIIPTGSTPDTNVAGTVKSIDVQGTAVFTMDLNFTFTTTFTIGANATVVWGGGSLLGGGILTNNGTINTLTTNVTLNGATTINNENMINLTGAGDIFIGTDSVINNNLNGTIDFQFNGSAISASGIAPRVLTNTGLIKTSFPVSTNFANIGVEFTNNGGTIQVESGTLNLANANTVLNGGVYNVFVDANLDWDTALAISGVFTGNIAGTLNWRQTVTVATTATFNFGGTEIINWLGGNVDGGGTLTNQCKIHTNSANVIVTNGSTLINQDTINLTAAGDIFIGTNATLNNEVGAVIDFQFSGSGISPSGTPPRTLINSGLIKTSFGGADSAIISAEFTNSNGTIQVENGTLNLSNGAIQLNAGTYNVFPTGTLDWDTTLTISGTLTGVLDGTFNIRNGFSTIGASSFNFTGNQTISWLGGNILGGGTFTNEDIFSTFSANTIITGATTFNNNGTINLEGAGDIFVGTDAVLNNQIGATIDIKFNGAGISASGIAPRVFNNYGLLKMTTPLDTENATINLEFNNNDGTIQVESGILNLSNGAITLTDGTYNTFATGTLEWDLAVTALGTLTGTMDGTLNWRNSVIVNPATTATFNFGGAAIISWVGGNINGGGTLINQSTIRTSTANVFINGASTFSNEGTFDFDGAGDLFISTNGIFNNETSGTLNMLIDAGNISVSGIAPQEFNNLGTLNASAPTLVNIGVPSFNSGTINVNSGELEFSTFFHNQNTGIITGIGTLDIPIAANFTNDGTMAPGASPGTLTVLGDYSSTATAVLDVELNGLVQGTEYDYMPITGNNAVFDGSVVVTMGFDATIGDEFIIATTSTPLSSCTLAPTVSAVFDGKRFDFSVFCRNNNEVVLEVIDRVDIQAPNVITQNVTVQLDAAGNGSITTADIDNGSTDNCTLQPNLLFSLDITDFTCADLGPNTVTLTVTDEAGNSDNLTAEVTVEDTIAPTVVTKNVTVQLDASGNGSTTAAAVNDGSTDNCTVSSLSLDVTDFTCADLGANTVNLTVTDQSGNSDSLSTTVTVEDNINPTVVTQNITIQLDGSGNASTTAAAVDNGSSDNCTVSSLSLDVTDFTCADLGANTVNLTVTDQSGNSDSLSATVTVEDNVAPTVVTQNITVQLDASGNVSTTAAAIDNGSTDNCTVSSLSLDVTDFTCADLGANIVNLTVTDQSGNSDSLAATVTVEDNVAPTVVTQNVTVQLDGAGNASVTAAAIDNGSTDACGIASLSLDITDFTCADLGPNIVTLTVTDNEGNSGNNTATVTVEDSIDPVIVCGGDITIMATGYTVPDYVVALYTTASDNCNVASISQLPLPGTILGPGTISVDFVATDDAGNTMMCSFMLTVDDTLGVESNELENSILVFPNPIVNVVTIKNNANANILNAQIVDVKGSLIQEIDLEGMGAQRTISMENYASGIYFMKINSSQGSIVKRLIKQ